MSNLDFSISPRRLAIVGVCGGLVAVLLFVAGALTVLLLYPRMQPVARATPVPSPKPTAPVAAAAAVPPPQPQPEAPQPAAAPAPAPVPQPAGMLTVEAGSFSSKENADHLAETLKSLGYPAQVVDKTDLRQRLWHIVRLGPYREWESASRIAAELSANQDLYAVVRPLQTF